EFRRVLFRSTLIPHRYPPGRPAPSTTRPPRSEDPMRRTGTRTLVPLALAFALAACSPPAGGPTLTAEETGDRLGALALRASNVIGDPAVGEFHQAVAGLAPAGLPAGTGGDLPRGVYRFDDESGAWVDRKSTRL